MIAVIDYLCMMQINRQSPVPLHAQAEALLRELISREEYRNGKLLPKETQLAEELGISRNTLRQAINKLVFEGQLERRKGFGTKVVPGSVPVGVNNWLSFSGEMKSLGIEVHNYDFRVSKRVPTMEVASFFNLDKSLPLPKCVVLERVRGDKDNPFVYFVSFFNPAVPITGEENFRSPLYDMLEKDCGIKVKKSYFELSASIAGDLIAEKLEIKASDPVLVRKGLVYDNMGVPIEFNIGYYCGTRFTCNIELER